MLRASWKRSPALSLLLGEAVGRLLGNGRLGVVGRPEHSLASLPLGARLKRAKDGPGAPRRGRQGWQMPSDPQREQSRLRGKSSPHATPQSQEHSWTWPEMPQNLDSPHPSPLAPRCLGTHATAAALCQPRVTETQVFSRLCDGPRGDAGRRGESEAVWTSGSSHSVSAFAPFPANTHLMITRCS